MNCEVRRYVLPSVCSVGNIADISVSFFKIQHFTVLPPQSCENVGSYFSHLTSLDTLPSLPPTQRWLKIHILSCYHPQGPHLVTLRKNGGKRLTYFSTNFHCESRTFCPLKSVYITLHHLPKGFPSRGWYKGSIAGGGLGGVQTGRGSWWGRMTSPSFSCESSSGRIPAAIMAASSIVGNGSNSSIFSKSSISFSLRKKFTEYNYVDAISMNDKQFKKIVSPNIKDSVRESSCTSS